MEPGFYLTTSRAQADSWVRRKFKGDIVSGWLNVYEYNEDVEAALSAIRFIKAYRISK